MTNHTDQADIRRRAWQARGAASDRRTTARLRQLMLLIITAVIVWMIVRLT